MSFKYDFRVGPDGKYLLYFVNTNLIYEREIRTRRSSKFLRLMHKVLAFVMLKKSNSSKPVSFEFVFEQIAVSLKNEKFLRHRE